MTPEDKDLMIEELAELDRDEQRDLVEAVHAGQDFEVAYQGVRAKYRARFLDVVKRHQDAPVYRIPFPSPHAP